MRKNKSSRPSADVAYLTEFMRGLRADQGRLKEIQTVYDNLTLLGQLLCAGTDITQMRTDFRELADVLLTQLARELRKKAVLRLRSDARVAIDILIRNLFERTADIGFLAMDEEIRRFAEAAQAGEGCAESPAAIRARFDEYVRKYSVYHNIMLLSPTGEVLAQLDESNPVRSSGDSLIAASLTTEASYVETFRPSDLLPGAVSPLIYSYRVMSADGSRAVGVLCLCFRFEDECRRIFDSLLDADDWTVITILSPEGRIIASSDPYQFPVGAMTERAVDDECVISRFAGREYLATTCHTHGYQGYTGPGWLGHAMAPLNHAFEMSLAQELENVPAAVRAGVLETATLFAPELRAIPVRASSIQRELNRAVWNGNVWLSRDTYAFNTSFAKVLLWEIGSTGMRTRNVFSESTTNLYETVVSSVLSDCAAQAALAIDIMDRNLYERANDCRWWALAPTFREVLSQGAPYSAEALVAVLRQINSLYTVYANLLVFDASGRIVAVSNPAYNDMVGQVVQADWVRQTLGLPDTQQYAVSRFVASPLYGNLPTYVYAAAIRSQAERSDPVGGIAIVFDAAPQFIAMLEDALPRKEDGSMVEGAFAVFAEKDGRVIASTDPELAPGMQLDIGKAFFDLPAGERHSNIIEYRGRYYAVGSQMSSGYREYKSAADSYKNDVVALVLVPLSDAVAVPGVGQRQGAAEGASYARRHVAGEDAVEIATFYIGDSWYGVRSNWVVEAIDTNGITAIPGMPDWACGCVMHNDTPVTIFDLAQMLTGRPTVSPGKQVVIIRHPVHKLVFGLLVDALGEIPEISAQRIEPVPGMLSNGKSLTESLVKPHPADEDKRILVLLSPDRILQRLAGMDTLTVVEEMPSARLEYLDVARCA